MAIPVATPKALLADKVYDGNRFRDSLLVRGILPIIYYDNIARYVSGGGALLIAAGALAAWVTVTGGFKLRLGDTLITSHGATPWVQATVLVLLRALVTRVVVTDDDVRVEFAR
mgnify:CR=1 FL=1